MYTRVLHCVKVCQCYFVNNNTWLHTKAMRGWYRVYGQKIAVRTCIIQSCKRQEPPYRQRLFPSCDDGERKVYVTEFDCEKARNSAVAKDQLLASGLVKARDMCRNFYVDPDLVGHAKICDGTPKLLPGNQYSSENPCRGAQSGQPKSFWLGYNCSDSGGTLCYS